MKIVSGILSAFITCNSNFIFDLNNLGIFAAGASNFYYYYKGMVKARLVTPGPD